MEGAVEAMGLRRESGARGRTGLVLMAALLFVAMFFVSVSRAEAAFSDVSGDEWFAQAVDELSAAGVVEGRSNGTFGPYEPVTRAQFAAFLHRILQTPQANTEPFTDVYGSDWYYQPITSLYHAGLVKGTSGSTYSPNRGVSREQVTSFIIRAVEYKWNQEGRTDIAMLGYDEAYQYLGGFYDRPFIADAHKPNVGNAVRLGIVKGYGDNHFYPFFTVTRAQAVGMLYRAFYSELQPLPQSPGVPYETSYQTLSPGSSGALVSWLEKRLASMTYQPGPADGSYDQRTKDAVIAFQKVEGLSRDGVAGPQVWARIFSASKPSPRLGGGGNRVEVDLSRQVLYLINGGSIVKILPVSTGTEGWRTPPGHFSIFRKLNYWRRSPLGLLYKPSYFNGGIAIHGAYSVPVYPASHGCVRVPYWATDALYPQLPFGMSVDVYY